MAPLRIAAGPAPGERTRAAARLMERFAERTRLGDPQGTRRYLWTDAFAVCNFLALGRLTGEARFDELALQLVDRVHHTLGRHRPDDTRRGWLGGAGEAHPTRGGLRIGKPLPERRPDQPADQRLEWDRDGQYFHYLVKWMHALDQVSGQTRQPIFNAWARELAEVGHRAFTYAAGGDSKRMIWKASIDLSRPLVASMGQHDPLDGWLTCVELEATARALGTAETGPDLSAAMADFAGMIEPTALATDDPLGLGGLLADALRLEQLAARGAAGASRQLLPVLLETAAEGVRHVRQSADRRRPAHGRLAFRELGLAIGLAAVELAHGTNRSIPAPAAGWASLAGHVGLREEIESFWLEPAHRESAAWLDHEDINDVMLATSLVPEGFLLLSGPQARGG